MRFIRWNQRNNTRAASVARHDQAQVHVRIQGRVAGARREEHAADGAGHGGLRLGGRLLLLGRRVGWRGLLGLWLGRRGLGLGRGLGRSRWLQ